MVSNSIPSLSRSNALLRDGRYFESLDELCSFHCNASPSPQSRMQNSINWNLSKIISEASNPEIFSNVKGDILDSLGENHLNRNHNFAKLNAFELEIKSAGLNVEVEQAYIEYCDNFCISGWIACNQDISKNKKKPLFILKGNHEKTYLVEPTLTKRVDTERVTKIPSYQFMIDLTPLFPSPSCFGRQWPEQNQNNITLAIISSSKYQEFNLKPENKKIVNISDDLILFASHDLRNAGAQNSLLQMVERFSNFTDLDVAVISPSDGPMRKEYEGSRINFLIDKDFSFGANNINIFFQRLFGQITTLSILNPKLIVANTFHTSMTVLAASCLNIPSIIIPRESEDPFDLFKVFPPSAKKYLISTLVLADKSVFVSKYTREKWVVGSRQYLKKKYLVINNGLNISKIFVKSINITTAEARKLLGIPVNSTVSLAVGTVTNRKGQFNTIMSFVDFLENSKAKNCYLLIVGLEKNNYSRMISEYIQNLPLEQSKYIKIFDSTKSPSDNLCAIAYKASDVFIMSSILESYPRVVLEAISYSLAIISTPCFGVKEMLESHQALFYEHGDIQALSQILINFLCDKDKINELKKKSSQAFKNLESVESMTQKYLNLFKALTSK